MLSCIDLYIISSHFPCPAAVKGGEHIACTVKVKLRAQKAQKLYLFLTFIDKLCTSADNVAVLVHIVIELQYKSISLIPQGNTELLCLFFAAIRTGQGFKAVFSLFDFCLLKQKIRGAAAVRMDYLHKRLPDIAFSIGGHLQSDVLQ